MSGDRARVNDATPVEKLGLTLATTLALREAAVRTLRDLRRAHAADKLRYLPGVGPASRRDIGDLLDRLQAGPVELGPPRGAAVYFDVEARRQIAERFSRGEQAVRLIAEYEIDNSVLEEIKEEHGLGSQRPTGQGHRRPGPPPEELPVARLSDPEVYRLVPGLAESLEQIPGLEARLQGVQQLVTDTYYRSPRGTELRTQLAYVVRVLRERYGRYAKDIEEHLGASHSFATPALTERYLWRGGPPPGLDIPAEQTEQWALDTAFRVYREYARLMDSWIVARAVRRDLVAAMLDSGYWTGADLSDVSGMPLDAVMRLRQGVTAPGRLSPVREVLDANAEVVLAAARAGATQRSLGQFYEVSPAAVKEWFHFHGHEWPTPANVAGKQWKFTAAQALAGAPRLLSWLRSGIRGAGLTQAGLAARINVPVSTVEGWMRGRSVPSKDRLRRVEEALGSRAPEEAWRYLPDTPLLPVTDATARDLGKVSALADWIAEFELHRAFMLETGLAESDDFHGLDGGGIHGHGSVDEFSQGGSSA